MARVNSLWPSDTIWRQRSGSTLAQVMACCLTAPSHYLNQCWLIISEIQDIHIGELSQEMPQPSITKMCLKITCLRIHSNFPGANELIHWGPVTHICVSKLSITGSDNGLSPDRRQAIIWTNVGILLIGPLGTNFSEILIEIQIFLYKKTTLKMSSAKRRPFCLGLNVLILVPVEVMTFGGHWLWGGHANFTWWPFMPQFNGQSLDEDWTGDIKTWKWLPELRNQWGFVTRATFVLTYWLPLISHAMQHYQNIIFLSLELPSKLLLFRVRVKVLLLTHHILMGLNIKVYSTYTRGSHWAHLTFAHFLCHTHPYSTPLRYTGFTLSDHSYILMCLCASSQLRTILCRCL